MRFDGLSIPSSTPSAPTSEASLTFWMRDAETDDFLLFTNPSQIVILPTDQTESGDRVGESDRVSLTGQVSRLERTDQEDRPALLEAFNQAGPDHVLAGALSYDACKVLDSTLKAASSEPVFVGGYFSAPERLSVPEFLKRCRRMVWPVADLHLQRSRGEIMRCIETIREEIRCGHVYQANFTFSVNFTYDGDAEPLFAALYEEQPASYAAGLLYQGGGHSLALLSLSPELFFRVQDGRIYCRPMKGTARRTGDAALDERSLKYLRSSEKERAENAMIVDLIRNDIGQVCRFGSVEVSEAFAVQTLPSVFQMTTDVSGWLTPSIKAADLFTALFPCGSVTGAPKRAAIELLDRLEGHGIEGHGLERRGRGFYTGSMGWTNGTEHCWNVAIRTVQLENGRGSLAVGSGITIDSDAKKELRECLDKLAFFRRGTALAADFFLYETLLFRGRSGRGFWMQDEHLRRLHRSARYFGLPCSVKKIERRLKRLAERLHRLRTTVRVHLRLLRSGRLQFVLHRIRQERKTISVVIQEAPSLTVLPYLHHKTSVGRRFYDVRKGEQEALFLNERGEVTESSIYSVFCRIDGQWLTPPLTSALLAGLMRERILHRWADHVQERTITATDLRRSSRIVLVNSVRGLRRAVLSEG